MEISKKETLSLLHYYLGTMTEMLKRAEQSDDLDLILKIKNLIDQWYLGLDYSAFLSNPKKLSMMPKANFKSIKNKKVQEILDNKPSKEVLFQSVNITDEYLKKEGLK